MIFFVYKNLDICSCKILLYNSVKLIAFWRNACILNGTGLEVCQATVGSIKRIVHMYILIGKIHPTPTRDKLICTVDV